MESADADMFRPPINRAMRVLDRSYFQKKIPLAAARVLQKKQIAKCKADLTDDLLKIERLVVVRDDPVEKDQKALLLTPEIKPDNASTWSEKLRQLVEEKQVDVTNHDLELTYDYWNYHDIMTAILPEEDQDELPTGFNIVGHVGMKLATLPSPSQLLKTIISHSTAHLNLRENYLPYKHLIATVLLDKNPSIRTVINKTDLVGSENPYRTFSYELLAGSPDLSVEVSEEGCLFRFDYSKVYWNSKLNTEHKRLVELFQEGEAVCDVMAGVGPFAVPAGKKRVFVWANDLNPDSHEGLVGAVERNKVSQFIRPSCEDGHSFIRTAARKLRETEHSALISRKASRNAPPTDAPEPIVIPQPKSFAHYVMNLPASAITFLPNFIGVYKGEEKLFMPYTETKLPMIHVYCFSTKANDNKAAEVKICKEVSEQMEFEIRPGDEEVTIWDVRDVAPQKRMFCASFRLPGEVAFRC
ncbi:MAG: hypothetical protein Q9195_001945 [Heterodermia aff. obscurata]